MSELSLRDGVEHLARDPIECTLLVWVLIYSKWLIQAVGRPALHRKLETCRLYAGIAVTQDVSQLSVTLSFSAPDHTASQC